MIEVINNTIDRNENDEQKIEEAKNNVEKDEAKLELNNLIYEINNKKIDKKQIDNIRQWINEHQNEANDVYSEKINEVKNSFLFK